MRFSIVLIALLSLSSIGVGCAKTTQAQSATTQAALSLAAYQNDMRSFTNSFITSWRAEQMARIDAMSDAELKAETKPDGTAIAQNIRVIEALRLERYAAVVSKELEMRAKIEAAEVNGTNAIVLLGGLKDYFADRGTAGEAVLSNSDAIIALLEKVIERYRKPVK